MKDAFFSFNNFEHTLDSFLGWLFNTYRDNSEVSQEIARSILIAACGLGVEPDAFSINKDIQAIPQPSKDKSSADLVVKFVSTLGFFAVFIENKTKSKYSGKQIRNMMAKFQNYDLGYWAYGRHVEKRFAFLSTLSAHESVEKLDGCNYVLKSQLRVIFEKALNGPDKQKNVEWPVMTFYEYLNGNTYASNIGHYLDENYEWFVKNETGYEFKDHVVFLMKNDFRYQADNDYSTQVILQSQNPKFKYALVIFARPQSKRKLLVRIYSTDSAEDKLNEKKIHSSFQGLKGFASRSVDGKPVRYASMKRSIKDFADLNLVFHELFQKFFELWNGN